ncbi:L-threonylcarbamoyladenylate synthase [Brachybacterium aquaticum]|uniref:L-threonylcarbamoyladenylate synthase n=1 Tax=Brachybacterium aquaticum TaxID=1432564 RepID=A0A841ADD0_9MICO|nr:L-threonylcarbamoyladenylate synthase [Brachybacterium aquaticum]MBB5831098.1 tRNA threonylcarbamoyl adenosine modification protein (Sua5/YciO/YrdC/YwlC family) [Brachybacterium aquaticum]
MSVHDTQNPDTREDALAAAVDAVRAGQLIVLPTDTVYGIGADAFTPDAVQDLLDAKGRGRDTPPPVLIGAHAVLHALATDIPDYVEDLVEELWPGALTLILTAQPSLTWDLGETRGTVALRMPDDETALELLRRTGPLAVSSANRHGKSAALTVLDAATQLGDSVEVYLDGGVARLGSSSTILDTTVTPAVIVREGEITKERIIEVVGDIFTAPAPAASEGDDAKDDAAEHDAAGDGTEATEGAGADGADAAAENAPSAADATDAAAADAADAASGAEAPSAGTAQAAEATGATEAADSSETPAVSVLDLPSEPDHAAAGAEPVPAETPLSAIGDAPAADVPDAAATGTADSSQDGDSARSGRTTG